MSTSKTVATCSFLSLLSSPISNIVIVTYTSHHESGARKHSKDELKDILVLLNSWPKFATNHVINMWQNEPRISAVSKAHVPRMWLSHVHIVVLFLYNINYHELYKFLFYKISKLYLWYE